MSVRSRPPAPEKEFKNQGVLAMLKPLFLCAAISPLLAVFSGFKGRNEEDFLSVDLRAGSWEICLCQITTSLKSVVSHPRKQISKSPGGMKQGVLSRQVVSLIEKWLFIFQQYDAASQAYLIVTVLACLSSLHHFPTNLFIFL